MGRGWDQNDWGGDGAFPTRADLDAAFPDRPVWLGRVDGHAGWANTAALRAAGIDPDAPAPADPEGGAVLKDADGRPTGVFVDAAEALVANAIPAPDEATMAEMRFYLHSRLGPQAHNLHASWGASSINDLNATRLRHLCALVYRIF